MVTAKRKTPRKQPAVSASQSKRIRLFHWRASEAETLTDLLTSGGFQVEYLGDDANGNFRSMRETPPHAAVIDLTRLPSHGRYVGAEIRGAKALQSIPIVFVDGASEKVERIRAELPDAVFVKREDLLAALNKAKPAVNPVQPPRMMASNRTTAQKLGITAKSRVAVIDAPGGYAKAIGALPPGATLEEDPEEILPLTLWFVEDPQAYLQRLPSLRDQVGSNRDGFTRLWVVYPKSQPKAKTRVKRTKPETLSGLTQFLVRQSALDVGLVDYKVCSVDAKWTGMLFARKK